MILIGDKLVPFEELVYVNSIENISQSKANSMVSFGYNENLLEYTFRNEIQSAVIVSSIKEAIYANALNAKYIICEKSISKSIQGIAENYMFDSKVLAVIEVNDEIEEIALKEIDGVIYKDLLK